MKGEYYSLHRSSPANALRDISAKWAFFSLTRAAAKKTNVTLLHRATLADYVCRCDARTMASIHQSYNRRAGWLAGTCATLGRHFDPTAHIIQISCWDAHGFALETITDCSPKAYTYDISGVVYVLKCRLFRMCLYFLLDVICKFY